MSAIFQGRMCEFVLYFVVAKNGYCRDLMTLYRKLTGAGSIILSSWLLHVQTCPEWYRQNMRHEWNLIRLKEYLGWFERRNLTCFWELAPPMEMRMCDLLPYTRSQRPGLAISSEAKSVWHPVLECSLIATACLQNMISSWGYMSSKSSICQRLYQSNKCHHCIILRIWGGCSSNAETSFFAGTIENQ